MIIGPMDLVGDVKKLKGFMGLNPGNSPRTQTWGRLERVGLSSIDENERPYRGKIPMLVREGGIKEPDVSRYYKKIFREDVYPAIIKKYALECSIVFRLTLHFNVDKLFKAELEYL
jgi:hypothetical protein